MCLFKKCFFRFGIFILAILISACTTLNGHADKISKKDLNNKGLIVGRLNIYNKKTDKSMQDFFGPKYITYATRQEPKKVYELLIPKEEDYFVWAIEPGDYFFHHTMIREGSEEIRSSDFDPIKVRAGEIYYLGDIYIEIEELMGQESGKPVGSFALGFKNNVRITQRVDDESEALKMYLEQKKILNGQEVSKNLARASQ